MSKVSLNKEQLSAIKHGEGPLLIIAGAGTGKTTVITERIKYLISSGKAKPEEILALTFTEKAAREMEERVDIAMPYGYTQMWISTFHSFCDQILRDEALAIGLDSSFRLMTQTTTIQFVRENIFEFDLKYFRPLGNPTKFVSGMLVHFSRLQDEDISPVEYLSWAKEEYKSLKKDAKEAEKIEAEKWLELAHAYEVYESLKAKHSKMDFGDLITKTLKLFRDRPNVLKKYHEKFKYILVDEFQDTNYAQNELAILLAGKQRNITVSGDDDQSIYRFRGAAVSNIIHFRKTYPDAQSVVLTKNYRSNQDILDTAYKLITHNNPDRLEIVENVDKRLVASHTGVSEIGFIHRGREEDEADSVAQKIKELVEEGNHDYKDIAILVRANNHSESFIKAFERRGIPHQFLGPGKLFRQSEIIDLIAYLKVLYNFEDSLSFLRVLHIDELEIDPYDISKLSAFAKKQNKSIFESIENIDEISVSADSQEKVNKLFEIVKKHLKRATKEPAGQILYDFLLESGLLTKLLNPEDEKADIKAANISKFFDKLKMHETEREDATVTTAVDWIELATELGESPLAASGDWTKTDAVNILTVHSSKGLEFPVVFLVNVVAQRFPSTNRKDQIPIPDALIKEQLPQGDSHIQEERRLFYVGITRAQEKLFMTAADFYSEAKRSKKLSNFIFESLGDTALEKELNEQKTKLSFAEYEKPATKPSIQKQSLHIDYLSYSQIQTFTICPLHYKLNYLLKIPTPPAVSLSFGRSIHTVMDTFYKKALAGEKITKSTMKQLLNEKWEPYGYTSKKHENQMKKKGMVYLNNYFEKHFDPKSLPSRLEEGFVLPLVPPKGERNLKIGGVIDRVDKTAHGIRIIDYKTGEKVPTQKEVDTDMQLTFYALAAVGLHEDLFDVRVEDIDLCLYYFVDDVFITTKRTQKDLKKAVEEIFKVRREIEESTFECSKGYLCTNCDYKMFCNVDKSDT